MNRIKLSPLASSPVSEPTSQVASEQTPFTFDHPVTSSDQETCLFGPSIQTAQESVFDAIDVASTRFNIASKRIFLAGLGGGATMALRIAMKQPEQFAGVIALNGPMPEGHSVLSRWQEARQMPVFWAHHQASQGKTSAAAMCQHFQELFTYGFLNLVAREYPTLKNLESLAPREINKWIMEQIQTAIH